MNCTYYGLRLIWLCCPAHLITSVPVSTFQASNLESCTWIDEYIPPCACCYPRDSPRRAKLCKIAAPRCCLYTFRVPPSFCRVLSRWPTYQLVARLFALFSLYSCCWCASAHLAPNSQFSISALTGLALDVGVPKAYRASLESLTWVRARVHVLDSVIKRRRNFRESKLIFILHDVSALFPVGSTNLFRHVLIMSLP